MSADLGSRCFWTDRGSPQLSPAYLCAWHACGTAWLATIATSDHRVPDRPPWVHWRQLDGFGVERICRRCSWLSERSEPPTPRQSAQRRLNRRTEPDEAPDTDTVDAGSGSPGVHRMPPGSRLRATSEPEMGARPGVSYGRRRPAICCLLRRCCVARRVRRIGRVLWRHRWRSICGIGVQRLPV
jgi:hypothetical protein